MKSLYWRIYLTLVLVLAAFALAAAWLFQVQIEQERGHADAAGQERLAAMAVLLQRTLPAPSAAPAEQAQALEEWGQRLRLAVALDNDQGQRVASSELYRKRSELGAGREMRIRLDDGRQMVFLRAWRGPPGFGRRAGELDDERPKFVPPDPLKRFLFWFSHQTLSGEALVAVLLLLFVGVAAGAFPVVRRLTRRLEVLKVGVQRFGQGQLSLRVDDQGRDEVAQLARSFNQAAARIQALLQSHQSLLANASHELRSPLARLKMALAMLEGATPAQSLRLQHEIHTNIAELDALVEEVLLASRLGGEAAGLAYECVDVLRLGEQEARRVEAAWWPEADLGALQWHGDERLLRRALRNLLENAKRYGGAAVELKLQVRDECLLWRVCDRGPGVPEGLRERIFEPFFRLPGHAEHAGGVGLGLRLVQQIAQGHGGSVHCEAREGGGSEFVLSVPLRRRVAP